jgi:hypothetical protein
MACLLVIFSHAIIIVFDGLLQFEIFIRLNKDIEPPKICSTEIHSLLALKPACHLNDVVAFVAGTVPLLCVIDMKPLWVLRIKTVKAAERDYGVDVVKKRMEFRNIEMVANTFINEDIFVGVENI